MPARLGPNGLHKHPMHEKGGKGWNKVYPNILWAVNIHPISM